MDKIMNSQLDRVEAALTTLVDSITSYNPSMPAAQELVSAEDELMLGLQQLQVHQANHARIQALKAEADALSSEIRETTSTLAALRKEVLAVPVTSTSTPERTIPYTDLLNFATQIAPYTRSPIPFHLPPAVPQTEPKPSPSSPHLTNGSALSSFAFDPTIPPSQPTADSAPPELQPQSHIATQSLSRDENIWLNPHQNLPFTPWPSEELLRMGGLATIQGMVERGESLEGSGNVKDEEDVEVSTPEELRIHRRRESFNGVRSAQEKPAVFGGMDLYDPDEDG